MCGIVAEIGSRLHADRRLQSLGSLAHRGPDNTGEWVSPSGKAWLGHRRLSIVDLSPAGNQPIHNEDKSVWLVANGEIYNFPSLRSRLESLGHKFYSHSDSEVILHAYESWGENCVDYLQGMFAFALWDENQQRLLAARDPVGIKPLYYVETSGGIALASEAGALIKLFDTRPEVEPMAVAYVMTLGYVPSPWSIWKGIRKLEPGHTLVCNLGHCARVRKYWEPPRAIEASGTGTETSFQAQFEPVLKEHQMSDVPLGLFLSGGLDSSAVAAGLHDNGRLGQALTVSFPGSHYDEAPIASAVARHLGIRHSIIPLEIHDVNRLISEVAVAFDEPQGYSALLSMFLISRMAVRDFKVVLAGDGGDELFGGYAWYQDLDASGSGRFSWLRSALRPKLRRDAFSGDREKAMQHFESISPLHRHAMRIYPRFLPEEAEALLSPMDLRFRDEDMLAPLRKHFESRLPLQRALQRVDLMTFCTDSILAKVDRASMAHSLEVRVPFLDRRMVEWAFRQPVTARDLVESKPVLRDYLRPRVPKEVLTHPKQGFSLRVLDAFDWDAALDTIREGLWVKQGLWASGWERYVEPGIPFREPRIWNLLMLTRWAEAWF